jgi:tagatose-1,6-bisphosphate aldolase
LSSLQTTKKMFQLLELDIAPYLADRLGLDLTIDSNRQVIEQLLQSIAKKMTAPTSGVILDPIWSLPAVLAHKPSGPGLVIRLDRPTGTVDPLALPTLIAEWGVEAVRQNYGVAALSLWYNPQETLALEKKQMVAELADYCRHEKIAFMLKLQVLPLPAAQAGENQVAPPEQRDLATLQLTALQELRTSVDLLALQHPGDSLSCATITAELDCPWIMIANEPEYARNKELIRDAMENGAQGALLSAPLWNDLTALRLPDHSPDWSHIETWVATEGRDRVMELQRIINEYGTN